MQAKGRRGQAKTKIFYVKETVGGAKVRSGWSGGRSLGGSSTKSESRSGTPIFSQSHLPRAHLSILEPYALASARCSAPSPHGNLPHCEKTASMRSTNDTCHGSKIPSMYSSGIPSGTNLTSSCSTCPPSLPVFRAAPTFLLYYTPGTESKMGLHSR